MVLFSEMYISQLIGVPVVDRIQEPIGSIKDVLISIGETFPKIAGLLVKSDTQKRDLVLLMGEIELLGKQFVPTKSTQDRIPFAHLKHDDILVCRDLMDKQIVDINGAKVIRINDVKLAQVGMDIRLIAVDVGITGLLRRLGIEQIIKFFLSIFRIKIKDVLIGWDHIEQLQTGRITIPHKKLQQLHPADIASIISQVHSDERTAIFDSLTEKTAAEALHELEPHIQARLLMTVDTKKGIGILEKMPIDEVVDVLGDLPEEKTEEFLRLMRPRKSAEVRKLLKHPEETAGGLMTTEFISFPQNFTVEETINHLRRLAPDTETVYYLYVIDDKDKLTGVLSLRQLIIASPYLPISEIMKKDVIRAHPEDGQRKIAEMVSKYNLLAVPVVDAEDKLLGIVTVDDVMDFVLPPISRRKRHMLG